jgi:hypothetical protein
MSEHVHRFRLRAEIAEKEIAPRTMPFARQWMSVRASFDTREEGEKWLAKLKESAQVENDEIFDLNEETSDG